MFHYLSSQILSITYYKKENGSLHLILAIKRSGLFYGPIMPLLTAFKSERVQVYQVEDLYRKLRLSLNIEIVLKF